jgi:hypothetical protein
MQKLLKAMLVAAALGTGAVVTSSPADAHDYYRHHRQSGASIYFRTSAVRIGYYRGYNRYDDWRWRHRCYRYHDCGRHYGWRNSWRRRDW